MTRQAQYVNTYADLIRQGRGTLSNRLKLEARHVAVSLLATLTRPTFESPSLRLLYCHQVFDDQTTRFEQVLITLKEVGTFVDTETCLQMLRGDLPIESTHFHLSFDDGFRNIITNALPILKKHHVPAEVFVPTEYVGASFDVAQHYCRHVTNQPGVVELATWQDLQDASEMGFGISSHTRTHARLSAISDSDEALVSEIIGSKSDVEQRLGKQCRYISWTYGQRSDISERAREVVRTAGYEACFGAFRGVVVPRKTDVMAIPRHSIELQWPVSHMTYFAAGGWEQNRDASTLR